MLSKGDIYINSCNDLQVICTIGAIEGNYVVVHVSNSNMYYKVHQDIFEDTMRALGFTLQPNSQQITYEKVNNTFYRVHNHDMQIGELCFLLAGGLFNRDRWVYSPDSGGWRRDFDTIEQTKDFIEGKTLAYRIYFYNSQTYHEQKFEYINQAIKAGKEVGWNFQIELGEMICCAWDSITGLRFYSEYQRWAQDQVYKLAQVSGV